MLRPSCPAPPALFSRPLLRLRAPEASLPAPDARSPAPDGHGRRPLLGGGEAVGQLAAS